MLTHEQESLFKRLAEQIQSKVEAQWHFHRVPIAKKHVWFFTHKQVEPELRASFEQFVFATGYVVPYSQFKTGTIYLFPNLQRHAIAESDIVNAMQAIKQEQVRSKNRARDEAKHAT